MSDRNHMSGKKKTINRTSKKQENVRQRDARIKAEVRKNRRNQTADTRKRRAMKAQRKREKANNKPVVVISYLFLMLFIGMIGYFADYMINESEHTKDVMSSESASILEKNVIRGNILSAEGHVLATTKITTDEYGEESEVRFYPYGNMFCHVIGYTSRGTSGLEKSMNSALTTSSSASPLDEVDGTKDMGNNVITTLDAELTDEVNKAMGDYQGAAIGIEPDTGKVLFEISNPDFDPNTIITNYDTIVSTEGSPFLNRTTNGKYTPGSTFKLLTLLEYINEHPTDYTNYSYNCTGTFEYKGSSMQCINGTAHGYEDLYEAFAKSCNCTFSEIGCSLNITNFTNLCNSMLFNQDLPTDIDHKQSSFSIDDNVFTIMQTSIGQGQTLVTPLHLAMLASCVANNGTLMKPYIVSEIQDSNGETVTTYNPEVAAQLMTSDQANVLSTFMREVVSASYGTANALKSSLYTAYGKTGTAQIGSLLEGTAQSNALFMGYAEDESGKKIAICIVLENIGDGKSPVVSIAKDILDYYYNN